MLTDPHLRMKAWILLSAFFGLVALSIWSLSIGSSGFSLAQWIDAFQRPMGSDRASIVVWQIRMPRVLAGMLAGAGLAIAGAMMQAVTNNPLADPGLLGVNAGAAFGVVLCLTLTQGLARVT